MALETRVSPPATNDEADALGISITTAPCSNFPEEEEEEHVVVVLELPSSSKLVSTQIRSRTSFVDDDSTTTTEGVGPTGSRHSGQVELEPNHTSMHPTWKPWPHSGRNRTASPSASSERHTAQSGPPPPSGSKPRERKTATGREPRTAGSRGVRRRGGAGAGAESRRRRCGRRE